MFYVMRNEMTAEETLLVSHIREENAIWEAWVAEDPENRFAVMVTSDIDHWRDYGIHSVADYEKYELAANIVDTHKEAYGFKPHWGHLMSLSMEELEEESRQVSAAAQAAYEQEEQQKADSAKEFEDRISKTISMGAGDRETALRWIMDAEIPEEDRGTQLATADYIRWSLNLPYSYESEFKTVLA